ncbi:S-adenosylmethionine:tRNA ribosyltransferase-isomerase [Flavihumibacter petaseus]|uniref:S-adenosylmethionine:tRNA ribosyltransferase-isomerase n=1 Tax=Flavihumibacter petaseus NBRC 106054 TaxID=1220578 RepID=A0A0E9N6J6_9BACT|nr:S-adenosylmethionine:tRNA ribosyltransferase-isomerase [Flavihumibacter petaseus]GAO44965.1 S-adenosylmethionine--tRNA ribosyltransferase-isomerase [Flavihumibacter petaseus NBRC 106054]
MKSAPNHPKSISIAAYQYALPDNRIASFPLSDRDASKLLVFREGNIRDGQYRDLPAEIPSGYLLVFNQTRVVRARMVFTKPSGGRIEVFCLEPTSDYAEMTTALAQTGKVNWTCLVGGAAKWKPGMVLEKSVSLPDGTSLMLKASISHREQETFVIQFTWEPGYIAFAEVLEVAGAIPIPPYLKRESTESDLERYQTIYAREEGSVAAPTAGLHFTPNLLQRLTEKNINSAFVTLHVGAGTFKPVKAEKIEGHEMHAEWIEVEKHVIETLLHAGNKVIAVGTTSLRTLESIYWMGCKAYADPDTPLDQLEVHQWDPYDGAVPSQMPVEAALRALLQRMETEKAMKIVSKTSLLIAPGYRVRMVEALITNFHQPQSTLLLLVAAMVGADWKKIYEHALKSDYRFLSYGDGSILWKSASQF